MTNDPFHLHVVTEAFFGENAYVLWRDGRTDCLVIDPSFEADKLIDFIQQQGRTPAAILNTHGHADHIAGNRRLKEAWPETPLVIGHGDAAKLTDPALNLSRGYGMDVLSPPADRTVREGDTLELAGLCWHVLETPGHSSGHVVFVCRDESPVIVFGGDVLFQGSIGRTDFPDGSFEALAAAIRGKLYTLPDSTIVLPGHGPPTTVGEEKASNPFVPA